MPPTILAETVLQDYRQELTALGAILAAALCVLIVNRWIGRRGRKLATAVSGGELRPEVDTRLAFLQRLVDVVIIVIGLAVAADQFTAVDKVAGTILTSGAIAAAVIGFAARQTLANAIAGVLLAATQPLRIGDVVTFEGESGTVEDVRLTYTWLRTPAGARIIVPNERLAAGVLKNDTIVEDAVAVEPSIWLNREQEPVAAVDLLRGGLPDVGVRLAETSAEGSRVLLLGPTVHPTDRAGAEHALREQALRLLRDARAGSEGDPAGNVEQGS